MTTHGRNHYVTMTTVDTPADSGSPLIARDRELAARFADEALPYLNELQDRACRMTFNAVEAEDLVQETMLRAYVGYHTFTEGTNIRAWLFCIMANTYINCGRRALHRPSEYLTDDIVAREPAGRSCSAALWRSGRSFG
jgi:RNA polymerase sigma-70 factor (ECF subfamily)